MIGDINVLRQMLEEKDKELEECVLNKDNDCLGEEAEEIRRELYEILNKIRDIEKKRLVRNKDIAVGDYIRMDSGDIYRVTDILEPNSYKCKDKIKAGEYIAKYNKNLKELIEVKDIVNGMTIEEFDDEEGTFLGVPIYTDGNMDSIEYVIPLSVIEVETILTHEQYDNECYKID